MAAKSGRKTVFFCEIMPADSEDTLRFKNFVEIALSRSVSDINMFLHFTQKFKMAAKSGRKIFLRKVASGLYKYPVGQKFCRNRFISLRFRDKHIFLFKTEIQDGRQKWRENNFWEKSPVDSADTLWIENFVEIALFRSISEINSFLRFMQKFKMATKSGRITFFEESCQKTLQIPCGSKISSKMLYLAPFPT